MARTFFLKDAAVGAGSNGSLADGVQPGAAATTTTETVSSLVGAIGDLQVYAGSATSNLGASEPVNAPNSAGDSWRSELALTATVPAGTWTVKLVQTKAGAGANTTAINFRVWKSANADGSGATEITSGLVATGSDGVAAPASATFSPGQIVLAGEYLFLQIGWTRGEASISSNSWTVNVGANSFLQTPDFLGPPVAWQRSAGPFRFGNPNPVSRFRSASAYPAASSATAFTQDLTGTLSSIGVLTRLAATSVSGGMASAGSLVKQAQHTLSGAMASAGILLKKTSKVVGGSLASAGLVVKQTGKILAGSVTSSGILAATKVALLSLAGTLASAGVLVNRSNKALSAVLAPVGVVARQVRTSFTGVLGASGTAGKLVSRALSAVLSFVGSLVAVAARASPPPLIAALRGILDVFSLRAGQDAYALRAVKDSYLVTGQQAGYAIRGAKDLYSLSGKQDLFALLGRQEDAGANIMPLTQNFSVPLGDDATVTLTCLNSSGTAFDLTGCSLLLSVKSLLTDAAYLFQKSSPSNGIVIGAPATNGIATLTLNAADTAARPAGDYRFDLQVVTSLGKKSTLITGTLTLTDHPSR